MNIRLENARKYVPSAAAALLFTALLAQAPHAATVFIRIAPQDVEWEVWWLAILGGIVYAIALESATAYFVWRNKMRWAIAFAAFSIMHNVAYYMPGAWTFDVAGAQLSLRYIVSALLISASLPIAIAAFSHVHVESQAKADGRKDDVAAETLQDAPQRKKAAKSIDTTTPAPIAPPSESGGHSEAAAQTGAPAAQPEGGDVPTISKTKRVQQLQAEGYTASEIVSMTGITYSTVQSAMRRAVAQTNGTGVH